MKFIAIADTDIGISKNTNQDSLLVKHASYHGKEVLMAIVCDGMGGLSKGEVASATVIRAFNKWFDEELERELKNLDLQLIGTKWERMLKDLNLKISEYGIDIGTSLGTTFSGILFINDTYIIGHVGDTRVYEINNTLQQLTTDQTFIAREISRGTLTPEQAKTDKRRNMLLQCIGASRTVEPQLLYGNTKKGAYMLCSDGFRHEISEEEIYNALNPAFLSSKEGMHQKVHSLIEQVKIRQEKDNISAILIKVD